jgi:hypothetical protein
MVKYKQLKIVIQNSKKRKTKIMEKVQKNRKMILAILVLAVIFAIVTIVISINNVKTNTSNNVQTNEIQTSTDEKFIITEGTTKLNTSTKVTADKKLGDILIQNSKIEYDQTKGSTLTAKVTNDSIAKDNLKLKVIFIFNNGATTSETVALVGKIQPNETKYISAGTTTDATSATDISYEIVE